MDPRTDRATSDFKSRRIGTGWPVFRPCFEFDIDYLIVGIICIIFLFYFISLIGILLYFFAYVDICLLMLLLYLILNYYGFVSPWLVVVLLSVGVVYAYI